MLFRSPTTTQGGAVTPCVGVWIEIIMGAVKNGTLSVTPCVGVWIEIFAVETNSSLKSSLPAWECGLK